MQGAMPPVTAIPATQLARLPRLRQASVAAAISQSFRPAHASNGSHRIELGFPPSRVCRPIAASEKCSLRRSRFVGLCSRHRLPAPRPDMPLAIPKPVLIRAAMDEEAVGVGGDSDESVSAKPGGTPILHMAELSSGSPKIRTGQKGPAPLRTPHRALLPVAMGS